MDVKSVYLDSSAIVKRYVADGMLVEAVSKRYLFLNVGNSRKYTELYLKTVK